MEIKFIYAHRGLSDEYKPYPVSEDIPDWYKKTASYVSPGKIPPEKGGTTATIKRCMPIFDVLTSGYIIPTPNDLYVRPHITETGEKEVWYTWPHEESIHFHPVQQAPLHPKQNGVAFPKWLSPWGIQTPKGYSCLFMPPAHREAVFSILPGIVDTDSYINPVNFPFVMHDVDYEGLIPAGTPMAQVIPFKRDSWKMTFGSDKDYEKVQQQLKAHRTKFFDGYKNAFRQPKEFK
jgi:hypothetical protein